MPEAWRFCGLVWRHWKVNLTGGSLIAFLFLWQITRKSVPWWTYAVIATSTLFVSCFLTWRGEYRARIDAEETLAEAKASAREQITGEREQRLRAELQLAGEIAHKLSVDEIVLREAREGFRNLTYERHVTIAPRTVLNEKWVRQTAEKNGKTFEEINEAIDRLDGKFHWQL